MWNHFWKKSHGLFCQYKSILEEQFLSKICNLKINWTYSIFHFKCIIYWNETLQRKTNFSHGISSIFLLWGHLCNAFIQNMPIFTTQICWSTHFYGKMRPILYKTSPKYLSYYFWIWHFQLIWLIGKVALSCYL